MPHTTLDDLRKIVDELASERFKPHIQRDDLHSVARVVHCIAETLEETNVRVDPNVHMLRCSEAISLIGFLRTRYAGLALRRQADKKVDAGRASVDARNDLTQSGVKVTEAAVTAAASTDEKYLDHIAAELVSQELADQLDSLKWSLRDRKEVLVEISRNERELSREQRTDQ